MQNFTGPAPVKPNYVYFDGTSGDDGLYGTGYADEMHGRGGNDIISGGAGDDLLFGEGGRDTLYGGTGNDKLDGGTEDDILIGGAGGDQLIGGTGFDTASYATATLGVTVDLSSGWGTNDAAGDTFVGIEKIVGSNYGDILAGNSANDTFDGGQGDDWLNGGYGSDTLTGGSGHDNLMGGAGADKFVITANSGADTIADFQSGSDHVVLQGFGAKALGDDGVLAAALIEPGTSLVGSSWNDWSNDHDKLLYIENEHTLYAIETTAYYHDYDYDVTITITSATAVATFSDVSGLTAGTIAGLEDTRWLTEQDLLFA
jgi:Ca2+-binding RTX toxin-like protein